jgi:GDPmannose 4,6-dehydratase
MKKRAFITGITGQDGSYLAEYLLGLGYEVHAMVRRVALEDQASRLDRLHHLPDEVELHSGSLESFASILAIFTRLKFDECYHLGAQSFVEESFADSFSTMNTNIAGTHHMLEAIRQLMPQCRFYFAGSSEMFGKVRDTPQSECTPFYPRSPYGVSKVAGFELTRNYRESYGLFCCSGILFNHESPRRGLEFVTRKITSTVARIKLGLTDRLLLGNLEASRDWGHAQDYIEAMHRMLQQPAPDDYVIATGETHTVREFCQQAFAEVGLDYRDYVQVDPKLFRPAEVHVLVGDAAQARTRLGWRPRKTFTDLVKEMVVADLKAVQREHALSRHTTPLPPRRSAPVAPGIPTGIHHAAALF